MDRANLLHATINFSVAEHKYVQLILDTFIDRGQFNPSVTLTQLSKIKDARVTRDEREAEMYALWASNQIGQ